MPENTKYYEHKINMTDPDNSKHAREHKIFGHISAAVPHPPIRGPSQSKILATPMLVFSNNFILFALSLTHDITHLYSG